MSLFWKRILNRNMLVVFLFGISSGLPLLLIGSTFKAWMKDAQVDLSLIGVFAITGLPYTLKFLWSPLLDKYVPPFWGRRRGWIAICQIAIALGLIALSLVSPSEHLYVAGLICVWIAFWSASQDIGIDAYRREIFLDEEIGLGSSMGVNGYRVGMLVAGALALALADRLAWPLVYQLMAALMVAFLLITWWAQEPDISQVPRTIVEAVILPLKDYFSRSCALEILVFILLYKVGDSMASDMFMPFYLDQGFTKTQVAAIAKVFAFWASLGGGFLGGLIILKFGILRSLWVFGFLQGFSTLGFSWLAGRGVDLWGLTAVITFENLASGLGSSAYVAFMAILCNKSFTATQYALLSSLAGVPRVLFGTSSGYLAKNMGWQWYFAFCAALQIPGLVMLLREKKWFQR